MQRQVGNFAQSSLTATTVCDYLSNQTSPAVALVAAISASNTFNSSAASGRCSSAGFAPAPNASTATSIFSGDGCVVSIAFVSVRTASRVASASVNLSLRRRRSREG